MADVTTDPLVDRLRQFERVLEVGIGPRPDLAAALADAGVDVLAIDIDPVSTPAGVTFRQADVGTLTPTAVGHRDAVVARRLPPELHRPTARLAASLDAELLFTTLGGEFPAVEVEVVTIDGGTIYRRPAESDTVL